jgi:hypothetical protein
MTKCEDRIEAAKEILQPYVLGCLDGALSMMQECIIDAYDILDQDEESQAS